MDIAIMTRNPSAAGLIKRQSRPAIESTATRQQQRWPAAAATHAEGLAAQDRPSHACGGGSVGAAWRVQKTVDEAGSLHRASSPPIPTRHIANCPYWWWIVRGPIFRRSGNWTQREWA